MSPVAEATIYEALADVMRAVKSVGKDGFNTHDRYKFRGIDGVVNAVGPALRDAGVIVVPDVRSYEYGSVVVGKNRTEMGHARVVVAYTFFGPAGDSIVSSAAGEAFDSGDKATAKAMSVAFRTALLQSLALPTDDPDPDSQSYERSEAVPTIQSAADAALTDLRELCTRNGLDLIEVAQDYADGRDGKLLRLASEADVRDFMAIVQAGINAKAAAHDALIADTLATERPAERLQGPDPEDPWAADGLPTPTEAAKP